MAYKPKLTLGTKLYRVDYFGKLNEAKLWDIHYREYIDEYGKYREVYEYWVSFPDGGIKEITFEDDEEFVATDNAESRYFLTFSDASKYIANEKEEFEENKRSEIKRKYMQAKKEYEEAKKVYIAMFGRIEDEEAK